MVLPKRHSVLRDISLLFRYGPGGAARLPSIALPDRMTSNGAEVKILQRRRVPRFTMTGDGLPGDPVNLVLTGTLQQLRSAFNTAEWSQADRLGWQARGA